MKIKEVAFVGYPVSDVKRARDFYENVLGLKASMDEAFDCPNTGKKTYWIEYDISGVALAISNAWSPTGHSGPTLSVEVDDLDAWHKMLTEKGIKFAFETMDTPGCRFFGVKDPDGNDPCIHQLKAHRGC